MGTHAAEDDAVMIREVNGEVLLLDNRTDQIHQLNGTASFIWRLCRQGASVQDTAAEFAQAFDIDEKTAQDDVAKTLAQLRVLNLLP